MNEFSTILIKPEFFKSFKSSTKKSWIFSAFDFLEGSSATERFSATIRDRDFWNSFELANCLFFLHSLNERGLNSVSLRFIEK